METKITISNPNPYKSKKTGKEMISYVVTGSVEAVAQYRKDQVDTLGTCSEDDAGNPLYHIAKGTAMKHGAKATLTRQENQDGTKYWFNAEATEALSAEAVAGMSAVAQRLLAEEEVANAKAFNKVLSANRSANLAKFIASQSKETAKL